MRTLYKGYAEMSACNMKADSASHLLRHPINFELFLFFYLVCSLIVQKINVYKTNFDQVDCNLVIFIIVILGRRLTWCILQEIQSHWKPKLVMRASTLHSAKARSSKGSVIWRIGWDTIFWNWNVNIKRFIVMLCTVPAVVWSVIHLVQNTPVFNLLFLLYPLLLYLSLFGFTLEPRCYRERYRPPCTFLQHANLSSPRRSRIPEVTISTNLPKQTDQDSSNYTWTAQNSSSSSSLHSRIHKKIGSSTISSPTIHHNGPNSLHHRHRHQPNDISGKVSNHATVKIRSPRVSPNRVVTHDKSLSDSIIVSAVSLRWSKSLSKFGPECSLLLPTTPDEVREEVDLLLSDLIVRLKQLLFNSLLCAYYVGFIPVQFADSHLYYDKWWCAEHGFLVWANSFVILASHLLPPSYCHLLYQCSLHLGCWTRCTHDEKAQIWSPDVIWLHDGIVQWNGESFKAEGPQNVAIPCDSSQECFYLLFHSRLHVHTWLLTMQCIVVALEIVVLLRSVFWYQTLSMSVFLVFNYFILYKLLYNRLWCRRSRVLL